MPGGRINRKGKLERDPTNRDLTPKHDAIGEVIKWSERRGRKKERKEQKAEKSYREAEKKKSVVDYVVKSARDLMPSDKLSDQSRHLFKGKTFQQAAIMYPLIIERFLIAHKQLFSPKALSEIMVIVNRQRPK